MIYISNEQNKASLFTIILFSLLLAFLYIYKWQLKVKTSSLNKDFIEVNLGDALEGQGEEPILKENEKGGTTKEIAAVNQTQVASSNIQQENPQETIHTEPTHPDEDAPTITNKPVIKPQIIKKAPLPISPPIKPIVKQPLPPKEIKTNTVTVEPTPPLQKAKAIFNGKIGDGNGSVSNNQVTSQGIGKAIMGDMGKPSGNINSKNYEGEGTGGTNINISSELRERGIVNMAKFEADFNQNANIKVEVRVDEEGNVSFIRIMQTNTTNSMFIKIIKQSLQKIKFKPKDEESIGSIEFHFKVNE